MSSPRNYRVTLQEGLCWKDCISCALKEQQGPFGSRKRGESDVYCRKRKKKVRGREVYGVGMVKRKGFLSPLEMNQFEVFFSINVIQKSLHNFFQSNKSYPQLSGVLPTLFSVLLGFFSLLFLYWPCRQPPWRRTHLRRSSGRHHSNIHGITHNKPSGPGDPRGDAEPHSLPWAPGLWTNTQVRGWHLADGRTTTRNPFAAAGGGWNMSYVAGV